MSLPARWPPAGRNGVARCGAAVLLLALLAALLSGCGTLPQPWEKGVLAKPAMSFEGDALEARFVDHVYTSKEAATGGGTVGGAGCGCN